MCLLDRDGDVDVGTVKYARLLRPFSRFSILAKAIGRIESADYSKLISQPVEKVKMHRFVSILKLPAPSCLSCSIRAGMEVRFEFEAIVGVVPCIDRLVCFLPSYG